MLAGVVTVFALILTDPLALIFEVVVSVAEYIFVETVKFINKLF